MVDISERLSKLEVILNTYRFYNFTLLDHPKIRSFQLEKLRIDSLENTPVALELDGELVGNTPVEFEILPLRLSFIK
ncbi:MAG: hypothetical protein R2771_01755 [Saprospiraceae bacterium]